MEESHILYVLEYRLSLMKEEISENQGEGNDEEKEEDVERLKMRPE